MLEQHLFAHTEVRVKNPYNPNLRVQTTYIPDGEVIPPEATVIKFYSEGDQVPNGKLAGIHDHAGTAAYGVAAWIHNKGYVGESIPIRTGTAFNTEESH